MSASSQLDLDNELNRNDETRNDVDFEDGDFLVLKPNYDRRVHAHHSELKICLLNDKDVFSEGVALENEETSSYIGFQKEFSPACEKRASVRHVQDGSYPNICEINFKRLDAYWASWDDIVDIDNSFE